VPSIVSAMQASLSIVGKVEGSACAVLAGVGGDTPQSFALAMLAARSLGGSCCRLIKYCVTATVES